MSVRFRLYFGPLAPALRAATQEELDRVESIVVEQEMELAWEARITMHLCLDERGHWQHGDDAFAEPFQRIRIELQIDDRPWTALIDGPVVTSDQNLDHRPGRSHRTIVVRDDSVLLNRTEQNRPFPSSLEVTDSIRVRALFAEHADVINPDNLRVEIPDDTARVGVQRGSAMHFLRELARDNGCRAYVLPADTARQPSTGCFVPDPTESGNLPDLILLGEDANLGQVNFTDHAESSRRVQAFSLNLSNGQFTRHTTSREERELLRDAPAVGEDLSALRTLPPDENNADDPERAARAADRRTAHQFKLRGQLLPGCYRAALRPYETVNLRAGDTRYSGLCLIRKVTHTLDAKAYTQSFEGLINALSPAPAASAAGPAIF